MSVEARLRARGRALRATAVPLLQTASAAGIAWLLAHNALGHKNAFFAPIAAVIVLGLAPGARTRRTIEMVIGVAVGIAVGELLISAIGTGAAQVGLVVLLAMAASILLGGGPLVATQAATSAVLVATVRTSSGSLVPSRFVDALVGGVVGIAVLAVARGTPRRWRGERRRPSLPSWRARSTTLRRRSRPGASTQARGRSTVPGRVTSSLPGCARHWSSPKRRPGSPRATGASGGASGAMQTRRFSSSWRYGTSAFSHVLPCARSSSSRASPPGCRRLSASLPQPSAASNTNWIRAVAARG